MKIDSKPALGKWRSLLWPIHRKELRKFFPMICIFFLIAFNYNLLRAYKDSMIVTAHQSGAEAIPFAKVWAILPCAILMTFIFTRLANRFNREKVFYIMMLIFLSFFFIFTFVLYPAQNYLHPHALADRLQEFLPAGCKGLIALFRNWTFTLFYVMSDLWSTAILSVLFWGFANEVTTVEEAKRYYGPLSIGANIAGIFSGQIAIYFSGNLFLPWIPYGNNAWDQSILFLSCTVIGVGILTMGIFRFLNVKVISPSEKLSSEEPSPKIKMSMRKNISYLAKSKYLICIAMIVLAYNLGINLIEVVWKNQINQVYPNPSDYNIYMGKVTTLIGVISTILGLFVTNNIIRRSWTATALISPIIMVTTGALFFGLIIFQGPTLNNLTAFMGTTPILMSIAFGSLQNSLTRACKFSLFDATKEIAFIPLSKESKLKGKAAIDGIGSRLGKSGGSLIHQGLLFTFSTVAGSTPYVGVIFLGVVFIWILSVVSLGKQFNELTAKNAMLEIPDTTQKPTILAKEGA